MSSDQGPSGPNRTVFRPSPLQNLDSEPSAPPSAAARSAAPAKPRTDDDVPAAPAGAQPRNPMMAEAVGFLALIASVRAGRAAIDLPGLHRNAMNAIAAFEQAMSGRYGEEEIRRAKYALASTADDVALNLPGHENDAAEWARRSMVVRFFGESIGGDRFWKLLDEMIADPSRYADVLELYHACLASGFEGRYRVIQDGKRHHHEYMQRVYRALEHPRRMSTSELVPRWRGEPAQAARIGAWGPVALAAAAAAVLLLIIYIFLRIVLAQTGQAATTSLSQINPDQPLRLSRVAPAPPAPPPGAQLGRLRQFLAPEIAQHLVVVVDDPSTVRVRTTVGQLFKSGSDQLDSGRQALFDRIGKALETEPGPIRVEGYSDSDKLSSVTFPDNVALSKARADTVAGIIRKSLTDSGRVTTDGYGDARPLAANTTAEGKAQNRRVEVVVQRRN